MKTSNEFRFKKIMVIDDNSIDLLIAERFTKLTGLAETVITFESAEEGLDYLLVNEHSIENLPQIILLDINMPGLNGFDFLQAFDEFSNSITDNISILMLSSSNNPADIEKATAYNSVSGFINKPLSVEKIQSINISKSELSSRCN